MMTDAELKETEEYCRVLIGLASGVGMQTAWDNVPEDADPDLWRGSVDIAYSEDADRRKVTSPKNGKRGGRPPTPLKDIADSYYEHIKAKHLLGHWRGKWYQFSGGRWQEITEEGLRARIMKFLRNKKELKPHARSNTTKEICQHLQSPDLCGIHELVEMPAMLFRHEDETIDGKPAQHLVAFKNGLMDIQKAAKFKAGLIKNKPELTPVTPDFWSNDFVDYDFSWEYEGKMPMFQKYLDEVADYGDQCLLQELYGLSLSDLTEYEVFVILYGDGLNGKGVSMEIIEALTGSQNISRVELATLAERFQSWPITECKINLTGDMPEFKHGSLGKVEGFFKNITGKGAKIDVERKNQAKRLNVPVRARFIFATNHLPHFMDKSDGIWRRLRIISFPNKIEPDKVDTELANKIIATEMPAICAWAIEGLMAVMQRGYVGESERGQTLKNQHRTNCDHERQFIDEAGYVSGNGTRNAKEVYDEYVEWMNNNGYHSSGSTKFYQRMSDLLGTEYKQARHEGKPTKCIIGIKSVTDVTALN